KVPSDCWVVAKFRQPTMLLICAGGNVGAGEAVEVGKAVRSAKAKIPFRPTFVSHGVGDGLGPPPEPEPVAYPARLISSKPPSSYTAKAYLPITALGAGAVLGPCEVIKTQSGAVKLGTGEESMVAPVLPRGIR